MKYGYYLGTYPPNSHSSLRLYLLECLKYIYMNFVIYGSFKIIRF